MRRRLAAGSWCRNEPLGAPRTKSMNRHAVFLLKTVACAATLFAILPAFPSSAQLNADAQRAYQAYQLLGPHRAFAVAPDGKTDAWADASGADPSGAVDGVLKRCQERFKAACTLYAVNNIVLNGRDWKSAAPPVLPNVGRLRPEPYWDNKGPGGATGLIVWSHGYFLGVDATQSAPQGQVAYFTAKGYDLYRFDRQYIRDWPGDATQLVDAVKQAKAMGYHRVILAGQSAGGWVSMAATMRGAPVDGVVSVSAAHHGEVKNMTDVSRARSEWQQVVKGIKPGPRLVVVNFRDDTYDVGGRMDDAKAAFAASGVDAVVISNPEGFSGHGAARGRPFPQKFGACIYAFIETGARQPPCI
jgi:pimeloyl-ACP methyl ester carboxylesterase